MSEEQKPKQPEKQEPERRKPDVEPREKPPRPEPYEKVPERREKTDEPGIYKGKGGQPIKPSKE